MITLNLLPDIKQEYLKTRRVQARVISLAILSSLVAVGLTVLLAFWVYAVQNIHQNLITDSIKKNSQKLSSVKDISKYVTLQSQLANLTALHEGKNNYSRLMDFLPQLNPKAPNNVRLSSIEIADEGRLITVEGETSNFSGLIMFRDILKNAKIEYKTSENGEKLKKELFSNITIAQQSLSSSQDKGQSVSFKISATYNPDAFLSSTKEITVSVPSLETTPSRQGTPSIFGESTVTPGGNN